MDPYVKERQAEKKKSGTTGVAALGKGKK
jgi:hypothetical protein